jgi:hypothetical protein
MLSFSLYFVVEYLNCLRGVSSFGGVADLDFSYRVLSFLQVWSAFYLTRHISMNSQVQEKP